MHKLVSLAVLIALIQGCGGGGSSASPTPTPSPSPSPVPTPSLDPVSARKTVQGFDFYGDTQVEQGKAVSLGVTSPPNDRITHSKWNQTSGPTITLLADNSQMISFDAAQPGDYQFQVSIRTASGQTLDETLSLTVDDTLPHEANVRLDHVAPETAKVSLRVDGIEGKVIDKIDWQQVAGPGVNNLTIQDNFLFFDAPNVNRDTLVEFRATISFVDGSSTSDNGYVLIKDVAINSSDGYFPRFNGQVVTTDMQVYQQNSPYASALQECVYNNTVERSCSFSKLPLLGSQTQNPDINDVMDRVLVSHRWMGDRFKQYLQQSIASPDMLKLLRAVTAVVISYDVRPSYYWSATGAIYLDGRNFWVTPEERDTLNDQPDFRSDFGNDLQFFIPWRYIKDNDYYFRGSDYPAEERLTKTFEDMEANITWLMYHELGHANDFFPPTVWQSMSSSTSPLVYSNDNPANSSQFSTIYPLTSSNMRALAQVSFAGETASTQQKAYTAQDVETFFEPDLAPAYYSYSTIREDYATLFERFMMSYRMGVSADVAVISTEQDGFAVTWGQRDRISLEKMRGRTTAVVDQILPEINASEVFSTLPDAQLMTPGDDWRDNADLSGKAQKLSGKNHHRAKPEWMIGVRHKHPERPKQ